MPVAGLIVTTTGVIQPIEKADYDTLRKGVGGGWLQAITLLDKTVMYIDEEGKLKGLMSNVIATEIARPSLFTGDYIVGDAVFVGETKFGGHHSVLSQHMYNMIHKVAAEQI